MKKNNLRYVVCLFILFIFISSIFLINYINNEIKMYKKYDNFVRVSDVLMISFNKDFSIFTSAIRKQESYSDISKTTQGDIIYDFSKYDMIPILSFLNKKSENEELIKSFYDFSLFVEAINEVVTNYHKESILVKDNENDFIKDDNYYIYKVNKKVLSKKDLNMLYDEYLDYNGVNTVLDNFVNLLYKDKYINKYYSLNELRNEIKNNYDKFYDDNEFIIINVIAKDLSFFMEYININIINFKDKDNILELKRDFNYDNLNLEYKFTKLKRVYLKSSKYYKYYYKLDLNSLFEDISYLGYPIYYI